jgi:alkylation response protein AidB-like acyl-CoA dehydrogenase
MDFKLSDENIKVVESARDFIEKTISPMTDHIIKTDDFPPDLMTKFAGAGMLGMTVPKKYGGAGSSNLNMILTAEELGKAGNVCGWPLFMNNSVSESLYHWGPEHIREKFLPPLCDGTAIASLGFTEPDTGSDPRAIKTSAVPEGESYVLNGTKRFITNGNKEGYGLFFAKDEKGRVTAFVIDKSSDGYSTTRPWQFMGLEGMNCVDVFLKNVRIPKEDIVGDKGKGFAILLRWIATERIQQAAYMVGIGQAAVDESIKFLNKRNVGGKSMGNMQGFQWMIAEMKAGVDACRYLTYRAACLQDDGEPFESISAELKLFVVPTIQEITRMALQIHGSYGYTRGYKVERLFRYAAHAGVTASSTEINKTIAGSALIRSRKR